MSTLPVFESVDAAVTVLGNNRHYFFNGGNYFRFDINADGFEKDARAIGSPGWKGVWSNVDAAFRHPRTQVTYFFKGDRYQRVAPNGDLVERTIGVEGWKNVWHDIDAALVHPDAKKVYFFKGSRYQRFDFGSSRVVWDGPINEGDRWKGVSHDIDAALIHPPSWSYANPRFNWMACRAYFFKGNQYQRYVFGSGVDKIGTTGVDGWRLKPDPPQEPEHPPDEAPPGKEYLCSIEYTCSHFEQVALFTGLGKTQDDALDAAEKDMELQGGEPEECEDGFSPSRDISYTLVDA